MKISDCHILLVDDEKNLLYMVRDLLKEEGYSALNKSKRQSLVHTLSEIVFLFFSFGTCQTSCSSIGNFPISSLLSVFQKL